jgi:glutathione peroxidase
VKIAIIIVALILVAAAVSVFVLRGALASGRQDPPAGAEGRLWDLNTRTLEGEELALATYDGQVALVVNVASKCGLTPQYAGLEQLYDEFKEAGFVILGFPSNDFMGQEPGSAEEIRTFCSTEYGVSFPLMEKVKVKGGDRGEIYRWLTSGGLEEPSWNFTKYLIGRDGRIIARFGPRTAPDAPELRTAIEAALGG